MQPIEKHGKGQGRPYGVSIPRRGGVGTATAGGVWLFFRKGETAGAADVPTRVRSETIETLDAARISKERTDEKCTALLMPAASDADRCLFPSCYRRDADSGRDESVPGVAAGQDDVVVALPDTPAELVAA